MQLPAATAAVRETYRHREHMGALKTGDWRVQDP